MLAGVAMAMSSLTVVGNSLSEDTKHEQNILYRNKDEKEAYVLTR